MKYEALMRSPGRLAVTATGLALLLGACGSQADPSDAVAAEPEVAAPTTTRVAPTPTTAAPTTTTAARDVDRSFTETSDVAYMTIDGRDVMLDIYTPSTEGPWPVVVAFHGLGTKDDYHNTVVAEAAAAAGMLVFTPTWVDENSFPVTVDSFELWRKEASCAVSFAQEHALEVGGDPARTVLYGFSAGVGPSLFASLQPITDPIVGCGAGEPPTPAVGVVLGDGEYLLHSGNFDVPFQTDQEALQGELASMIDPSRWPADLNAEFYLWVAGNGSNPRPIGDPESGWFAHRDPDGSIRADLDSLGHLDDGTVSYIDAGELLESRLAGAGVDVTLDTYPGGHTTLDKVPELISYIQAAVSS